MSGGRVSPAFQCRTTRQAESLSALLDSVHALREAVKLPTRSRANKEVHTCDDLIQTCSTPGATSEDWSSLIQAVKGLIRALKQEERARYAMTEDDVVSPFQAHSVGFCSKFTFTCDNT